jgi:hypothetical protein
MFKKKLFILFAVLLSFVFVKPSYAASVFTGFSYQKMSANNNFSASSLYFSLSDNLNNPLGSPVFNLSGMQPGDSQTKQVRITKGGSEDFKYNVNFVKTAGDDVLCNGLNIQAKLEGVTLYNGSLASISLSPAPTISGNYDDWEFTVSLPDASSSLRNKSCAFDLVFKAYQTDSDGTWGFSDSHSISNNLASKTWTFSNAVVINEIMWMGSTVSPADEWIELRNTTSDPIDLTGWRIDGAGSGSDPITLTGTIPANGFFLITNLPTNASSIRDNISADQVVGNMSLDNQGEQLTLRNASAVIIDQTPTGTWAAGENGADKKSMERNDAPGDGSDAASWHTCEDSVCHSTLYWDSDGHDFGTPKGANLSGNDPTTPDITTPVVADGTVSLVKAIPESTPSAQFESASSSADLGSSTDANTAGITPTPTATPAPASDTPEATPTPTPTLAPQEQTTSADNPAVTTQEPAVNTSEASQQ